MVATDNCIIGALFASFPSRKEANKAIESLVNKSAGKEVVDPIERYAMQPSARIVKDSEVPSSARSIYSNPTWIEINGSQKFLESLIEVS